MRDKITHLTPTRCARINVLYDFVSITVDRMLKKKMNIYTNQEQSRCLGVGASLSYFARLVV